MSCGKGKIHARRHDPSIKRNIITGNQTIKGFKLDALCIYLEAEYTDNPKLKLIFFFCLYQYSKKWTLLIKYS